ncbi:MAG TPA: hypothetical protein VED85_03655 [Burkholderiaceae bacterium]|nr:hypothetical protein [Burkholderiaceae bacterium]
MDNHRKQSSRSAAFTVIMAAILALTIFMPLSFVLDFQPTIVKGGGGAVNQSGSITRG